MAAPRMIAGLPVYRPPGKPVYQPTGKLARQTGVLLQPLRLLAQGVPALGRRLLHAAFWPGDQLAELFGVTRFWGIVRGTFIQAIRMRLGVVVCVFLLLLASAPILPLALKTGGELVDQLRVVITYSMYLIIFLMSALTIALAGGVLADEFRNKQIHLLDSKPVARWQVLLGKWLGVMLLNAAMLAILGGASYATISRLARARVTPEAAQEHARRISGLEQKIAKGDPLTAEENNSLQQFQWELEQLRKRLKVEYRLLTAYGVVKPEIPNLDVEVSREFERVQNEGLLLTQKDENGREVLARTEEWHREQLRKFIVHNGFAVPNKASHEWILTGFPTGLTANDMLLARFKHYSYEQRIGAPSENILGAWTFGAREQGSPDVYETTIRAPVSTINEIEIPASVLTPDGRLIIRYTNINPYPAQRVARFPYDSGLEARFPAGTIAGNYILGLILILLWLGLLAIICLAGAAILSFPITAFLALSFWLVALERPLLESFTEDVYIFAPGAPGGDVKAAPDERLQEILRAPIHIFPDFNTWNPVPLIVDGQLIPVSRMAQGLFWFLLRGGIIAIIGVIAFQHRELAGGSS